jgi:hypothetical protein
MFYFSYGSFLDIQTLKKHAPSAKFISKAILPNYEVQFNFLSKTYSGGVTGVEPAPGKSAQGVIYDITEDDLLKLDKVEGVQQGIYFRHKILVLDELGKIVEAETYRTTEPKGPFKPRKRYLRLMLKGAKQHSLDPDYIKKLEKLYSILEE